MSDPTFRVAVITGASRGIGKAIAHLLAQDSVFVYVNYRSGVAEAAAVVEQIVRDGGKAEAIGFDVANTEQVQNAFDRIAEERGGVDILVSNAGVSIDSLILRAKDEAWQKTVDTNLKGAFACTRAALKTMLRRKNHGRIVYLSSVVGQMGNAGQSMYAASKAGLTGLAKSIAQEVASRGITVNTICPGFVKTDMTDSLTDAQKDGLLKAIPMGRWADPEDIASVVRFLVSERASYITGQVVAVNGGMYL